MILESPVVPVIEGDTVILRCRNKMASFNLTAHFYKDGVLIRSSDTGTLLIHNVSKSDEGLYKCNAAGAEDSPESQLKVRGEGILKRQRWTKKIYVTKRTCLVKFGNSCLG